MHLRPSVWPDYDCLMRDNQPFLGAGQKNFSYPPRDVTLHTSLVRRCSEIRGVILGLGVTECDAGTVPSRRCRCRNMGIVEGFRGRFLFLISLYLQSSALRALGTVS